MNSIFFDFTNCKFRAPRIYEQTVEKKIVKGNMANVEETFLDFENFMNKYCGSY